MFGVPVRRSEPRRDQVQALWRGAWESSRLIMGVANCYGGVYGSGGAAFAPTGSSQRSAQSHSLSGGQRARLVGPGGNSGSQAAWKTYAHDCCTSDQHACGFANKAESRCCRSVDPRPGECRAGRFQGWYHALTNCLAIRLVQIGCPQGSSRRPTSAMTRSQTSGQAYALS
jgi:hypothetical protein